MTLLASYFDSPSADFSSVPSIGGNGISGAGSLRPYGIPDVLTLENGWMRAFHADWHAYVANGPRTEIYLAVDTFGTESWYTWDFMLPAGFWSDFTGITTFGQMHDSPDDGNTTPRQPNFMLQYNNRNLQATWPSATLPAQVSASRQVPGIYLDFDRWYSMCIRFSWKTDATGFREVFCDRVPICREWNVPTSYSDTAAPYFKLGLYITNNGNLAGDKVLYIRNLKRWSGNDGYTTVMGGVPTIGTRLVQA